MRAEPRTSRGAGGAHAVRKTAPTETRAAEPSIVKNLAVLAIPLIMMAGLLLPSLGDERAAVVGYFSKPISKVRIENQWQRVGEAEVTQILQASIGAGFFEFDIDGVSSELESLPWVASVELRRVWPDTLALHLKEEVPIAHWGQGKLLNQYGELFAPFDASSFSDLPKLDGPEASQERVMQQYKALSQILLPAGLRLNGLTLSHRGSWRLRVNAMDVEAGRGDILEKAQRFARFYVQQDRAETAQYESVDLRYSNGIAVKKRALTLAPVSGVAQR